MYSTLEEFGLNLGLLFQAVDDYLDITSTTSKLGKTAGKDEEENKLTYVKIFGKEQTRNYINGLSEKLKNIAKNDIKSEFLKCFIDNICPNGRV